MTHFLLQFFHYNPWRRGERNTLLLTLGRRLKSKHFSLAELEQVKRWVVAHYAEEDCDSREICTKIEAGYNYQTLPVLEDNLVSKCQGVNKGDFETSDLEDDADSVEVINDEARKSAPYFPDSIFQKLPPLIQNILVFSKNKRERDMLLMAVFACLSASVPYVKFSYSNRLCATHLYYIAIAKAGSGKGVVSLGDLLLRDINAHWERENRAAEIRYKKELLEWELEKRNAQKEGRVPRVEMEPEEPVRRLLSMPGNTSKSQLIISLAGNDKLGLYMSSSEIDLIIGAIAANCGGHEVVFRQAFHSEEVSSFFKVDKQMVKSKSPKLALCLSATPLQALRFIPNQENGMASRLSIYLGQTEPMWISAAPDNSRGELEECFKEFSKRFYSNFLFLLERETEVTFTAEQWERHCIFFTKRLNEVVADEPVDTTALVYRGGFIAMRLAAILTALRKCDARIETKEVVCRDEDFENALVIADVLLHHNLLFATSQLKAGENVKRMCGVFRLKSIWENIPTRFTFTQLLKEAEKLKVSKASVIRYLKRLILMGVVVKEGNMYVKTGKSW
ncbi:MAG: DUF3987 domain-containing protein [Phocaeicola sp.]